MTTTCSNYSFLNYNTIFLEIFKIKIIKNININNSKKHFFSNLFVNVCIEMVERKKSNMKIFYSFLFSYETDRYHQRKKLILYKFLKNLLI